MEWYLSPISEPMTQIFDVVLPVTKLLVALKEVPRTRQSCVVIREIRSRRLHDRAIKSQREPMGVCINKRDGAERVGYDSNLIPGRKVTRRKDRVNSGRASDSKLKRACQQAWSNQLHRERV